MLKVEPRNLNEDVDLTKLITNPNPLESDYVTFNQDGVFSQSIFGSLSNSVDWSCHCGSLVGEFNKGIECHSCGHPVAFKGLMMEREGWIDMVDPVIHPLFYRYIKKVVGGTALEKIINYRAEIKVEGLPIDPPIEPPYASIGMGALIENFEEILNHFLEKKNQKFYKEYKFIVDNIDKVFIQYLPVINSRLRPAILVDGEFSFDAINNLYNQLIQNSNLLKSLSTPERIPLNIYALQYKNQKLVNEIYDTITSNLSSKEGYIRSTLFGNRLNFTSRCVITPLDGSYDIDDIVIPYNAALELLKPQVLRRLANLKKCTLTAATEIFNKAVLEFDSLVYKIMIDIIENGNVRMLLNRNPSINLGSILMVKIAGIKRDMSDLTVSLHNLILKPIGGDYDGDVLNFILLYGQEFIDLFAKFKPSHIMIDMDNGTFNKAFLPAKDTILGLESLFN